MQIVEICFKMLETVWNCIKTYQNVSKRIKTYKMVQKPLFRSGLIQFYIILYCCVRFHTFLFFHTRTSWKLYFVLTLSRINRNLLFNIVEHEAYFGLRVVVQFFYRPTDFGIQQIFKYLNSNLYYIRYCEIWSLCL